MTADPFAGYYTSSGAPISAIRDSAVAWKTLMGIPQSKDNIDSYQSLQALSSAPADEAWVYACVAARFRAAASVRFRVYYRDGSDLVPAENRPTYASGDLQGLLDNPVDMTGSEARGYNQASRTVWGGCGWKKVRGRLSGTPKELYWLRAPDLTPHSENGRVVDYWQYHPEGHIGQQETIAPQDMIPIRSFNMASHIDFLSPLSAARYDIQTGRGVAMNTAALLLNRAIPEMVWGPVKGAVIGPQDQSAIKRFLRQFASPKNAGKTAYSGDIEPKPLALNPRDADFLNAGKMSRMYVSAVTGVPMLVAGDDDKASVYANFRDASVAFWRGTMVDELNGDAEAFNSWLVPDFAPDHSLVIAPDFSTVEALRPTFQEETTAWLSGIDHQAIVPDEYRAHFHIGGPVPWGQQPVPRTTITLRDTPTTPITIPATSGDTATTGQAPQDAGDQTDPAELEDIPAALRAHGRRLYKQTAVRAYVAHGGPLDTESLVGSCSDADRHVIEDGLTRRWSAERIADALTGVPA